MTATAPNPAADAVSAAEPHRRSDRTRKPAAWPLVLRWTTERDSHAPQGIRYVLRHPRFPKHHFSPLCGDDRMAACGWERSFTRGKRGQWQATFWIGYHSLLATGATAAIAMRRLEAKLDRRSIGLFGVDDVEFRIGLD